MLDGPYNPPRDARKGLRREPSTSGPVDADIAGPGQLREAAIPTIHDLRGQALALPGAHEVTYRGNPWFNVGKKTFALVVDGRTILKLDKGHQELLFEVRPETFQPCKVATVHWSYVVLENLDGAELADLLREAWSQIVPKKVSRPYLASLPTAPA